MSVACCSLEMALLQPTHRAVLVHFEHVRVRLHTAQVREVPHDVHGILYAELQLPVTCSER